MPIGTGADMHDLWSSRTDAIAHMSEKHPSRTAVIVRTFELLDDTIDAFEAAPVLSAYSRVCGITLIKAKNLALGAYSLILDGLGQEAGALMRPMIEYVELLTYFRLHPEMTECALENELPTAGARAKAIGGIFQSFREHLNREASHSSFSRHSIEHLFEADSFAFKKQQRMVVQVLERKVRDLVVQLHNLLHEAILTLQTANPAKFEELGDRYERLKRRMFDVFGLNETARSSPSL